MTSSGANQRRDTDFEQILAAVMETARGRWFLAEFTRRYRSADTNSVLTAVSRLEAMLRRPAMPTEARPAATPPVAVTEGAQQQALRRQIVEALLLVREGEAALEAMPEAGARAALVASRNAEARLEAALTGLGGRIPPRRPSPQTSALVRVAAPAPTEIGPSTEPKVEAEAKDAPATPDATAAPAPEQIAAIPAAPELSFAERLAAELQAVPVPQTRGPPTPAELAPMTISAEVAMPPAQFARPFGSPVLLQNNGPHRPVEPPTAIAADQPTPALPETSAPPPPAKAAPPKPVFRPATLLTLRPRSTPANDAAILDDPTASMSRAEKIALFS